MRCCRLEKKTYGAHKSTSIVRGLRALVLEALDRVLKSGLQLRSLRALVLAAALLWMLPSSMQPLIASAAGADTSEATGMTPDTVSAAAVTAGSDRATTNGTGTSDAEQTSLIQSEQAAALYGIAAAPEWVASLRAAQEASQLILVAADGSSTATLTLYEQTNGMWMQVLETTARIGRNGIGKSREGDGKTPTGRYAFWLAFGTLADPGTSIPYLQVDDSWYWVDDAGSRYYNLPVSTRNVTADWTSAEHLSGYPAAYAYALALNYNAACVPGAGSAIFLHCSTGSATSGCIAVSQDAMLTILQHLRPDCLILIDYAENLYTY